MSAPPNVQPAPVTAAFRSRIAVAVFAMSLGDTVTGCGARERLDFGSITNGEGDNLPVSSTDDTTQPESSSKAATPTSPEPPSTASTPSITEPHPQGPINGKIIDFWGHPVPNARLDVSGVSAVSASDGTFQAFGVPEVYDLSLVVRLDAEAIETYGWTYQGLTTRSPVLPVYRGLPPRRATLRVELPSADGATAPCGAIAIDGRHGHQAFGFYQVSTPVSVVWRGVDSLSASVQSLFWEPATSGNCDVPLTFVGWRRDTTPLSPRDDVTLTIADPGDGLPVLTGDVEGVVHAEGEGTLEALLFLRFASGATLPVTSRQLASDATFSFAVPVIDDTTLVVAASRSGGATKDYAVQYRSYVGGAREVELQPPLAPKLLQPAAGAKVSPSDAVFQWADHDGSVAVVVLTRLDAFSAQFLVTASNQVRLPELSHLGLTLAPDAAHSWGVEIHRAAPTVDEWLQSAYPLDPFSTDFRSPIGPMVTSGQFVRSEGRAISFAAE